MANCVGQLLSEFTYPGMRIRQCTAQAVANHDRVDQSVGEMKESRDGGQCDGIKGKWVN